MLGGTSFVGRAIVEDLLGRGHTPTVFSRGLTGTELFPEVERLIGDRNSSDYAALAARSWDAVVDVSAYVPRNVAEAIDALEAHAGRYLLISTGMVYDRAAATAPVTEASPRQEPLHSEDLNGDTYGPLKAACEDEVLDRFGPRASIIRPGWIVGPNDPQDRLTYWVRNGDRAGRIPVPERLDRPVQVVDVRDLARLAVLLLEQDGPGAYNAVGPAAAITLGELIRACGDAELVPIAGSGGDADGKGDLNFPLVLPDESWDPLLRMSPAAAYAAGMPCTPLAQTIADVRAWDRGRGEPPLTSGPSEADAQALVA